VEKWISGFIVDMIKLARPQGMWITCGKVGCLWKKTGVFKNRTLSTRQFFQQPVEKWKTYF
jgi:autotransporter translocation and assembly factor TamB